MILLKSHLSVSVPFSIQVLKLAFIGFFERLKRQRQHRKDYRMLAQYDDHLLQDIGLTRADVVRLLSAPEHGRSDGVR